MSCVTANLTPPCAPARRSRAFVAGVALYFALLLAAFVSGSVWIDDAAVFILVSVVLLAALRRSHVAAWCAWLAAAAILIALGAHGKGRIAVDAMPVVINLALCALFANSLLDGRTPLIARIIAIIEGPQRLALPRVAIYARHLTQAWALLFALQACVLLVLVACVVPDGALATFGIAPPLALSPAWRWYLHLGSFALVPVFLVLEYAFRRWYLRAIGHAPLTQFIARLARCWPALVRDLVEGPARHE